MPTNPEMCGLHQNEIVSDAEGRRYCGACSWEARGILVHEYVTTLRNEARLLADATETARRALDQMEWSTPDAAAQAASLLTGVESTAAALPMHLANALQMARERAAGRAEADHG